MTLAIFFEGGSTGEPDVGMRHIARVIAERAKANRPQWGGNTICGVVFYKKTSTCQFSFACLPLGAPHAEAGAGVGCLGTNRARAIGGPKQRDGRPHPRLHERAFGQSAQCLHVPQGIRAVTTAGRHEFFREASTAERRELEAQSHSDCHRYAASLKKNKSKKYAKHGKSKKYAKHHSKKKQYAAKVGPRS